MIQISIIIPVYNNVTYLRECLTCLTSQTFTEFEVLCIDDASENKKTVRILQEYAEMDNRFKVIENVANLGAGATRNLGIEKSEGKYLLFLDSDDLFENTMLEELYIQAEMQCADIVFTEYDNHMQVNTQVEIQEPYLKRYYNEPFSLKDLSSTGLMEWIDTPWNKMFRKSFIVDNGIHFQEIESSNDAYFHVISMMLAHRMTHVRTARRLVHYRINIEGQISSNRDPMCAFQALEKIYEEMRKRNIWERYLIYYYLYTFSINLSALKRSKEEHREEYYLFLRREGFHRLGISAQVLEDIGDEYAFWCLNLYRKFYTYEYESQWYVKENVFQARLKMNRQKLNKFFDEISSGRKKVVLWGAGLFSEFILEFALECNWIINYVVDSDCKKWETMIANKKIYNFDDVYYEVDIIIISNKKYYTEICDKLIKEGKKVKLFLLYGYLNPEISVEDCLVEI